MNKLEQRALEITRKTFSYRLLNLHIAWKRLFYGLYHDKTKQLERKRSLINHEAIKSVREMNRIYSVLRGEVRLYSGKELNDRTNEELDKIIK